MTRPWILLPGHPFSRQIHLFLFDGAPFSDNMPRDVIGDTPVTDR